MLKKIILIYLAVLCLIPTVAIANITLAVIAPKAGKHASVGNELFAGAKLAVDEINDSGGLNGKKLDLLTIDDRCDDRLAVSTAEMLSLLKSKKIGLVVGPYCSNRFNEIADIYEKSEIFQIVPTTLAYSNGNTEKKGQILLLGTQAQMSGDFFKFYNNNFAGLKVGVIYNDSQETSYHEVAKTMFQEFQKYGKSDLLKFYILNGENSNSDIISSLNKDKIGIILVLGEKEETIDFIKKSKTDNNDLIVFTTKRVINENNISELNNISDNMYVISLPGLEDSLMFTETLVNLRLMGIEPKGMEVYSYVAIKLWGDLVKQVGGFSYKKLSNAANSQELKEKWSEFLMHSGSMKSSKYTIEHIQNQQFKQVY